MKKLISLLTVGLCMVSASPQSVNQVVIPSVVRQTFAKMFPGIEKAEWDTVNNRFVARYTINGHKGSVVFLKDGKWIEREVSIAPTDLSKGALDYIQHNYKAQTIQQALKIMKASGYIFYKVVLAGRCLYFTRQGFFISLENCRS